MKIKYNKKGLTVTEGIHFENFCEIEVSDTIGKKLLKQKNLFKEIKEVEEVKTNNVDKTTNPKPTKSKTTRTRKPKVDKAEEKSE